MVLYGKSRIVYFSWLLFIFVLLCETRQTSGVQLSRLFNYSFLHSLIQPSPMQIERPSVRLSASRSFLERPKKINNSVNKDEQSLNPIDSDESFPDDSLDGESPIDSSKLVNESDSNSSSKNVSSETVRNDDELNVINSASKIPIDPSAVRDADNQYAADGVKNIELMKQAESAQPSMMNPAGSANLPLDGWSPKAAELVDSSSKFAPEANTNLIGDSANEFASDLDAKTMKTTETESVLSESKVNSPQQGLLNVLESETSVPESADTVTKTVLPATISDSEVLTGKLPQLSQSVSPNLSKDAGVSTSSQFGNALTLDPEAITKTDEFLKTSLPLSSESKDDVETEALSESEDAVETEALSESEDDAEQEALPDSSVSLPSESKNDAETQALPEFKDNAEIEKLPESSVALSSESKDDAETEALSESEDAVETEALSESEDDAEQEALPESSVSLPSESKNDAETQALPEFKDNAEIEKLPESSVALSSESKDDAETEPSSEFKNNVGTKAIPVSSVALLSDSKNDAETEPLPISSVFLSSESQDNAKADALPKSSVSLLSGSKDNAKTEPFTESPVAVSPDFKNDVVIREALELPNALPTDSKKETVPKEMLGSSTLVSSEPKQGAETTDTSDDDVIGNESLEFSDTPKLNNDVVGNESLESSDSLKLNNDVVGNESLESSDSLKLNNDVVGNESLESSESLLPESSQNMVTEASLQSSESENDSVVTNQADTFDSGSSKTINKGVTEKSSVSLDSEENIIVPTDLPNINKLQLFKTEGIADTIQSLESFPSESKPELENLVESSPPTLENDNDSTKTLMTEDKFLETENSVVSDTELNNKTDVYSTPDKLPVQEERNLLKELSASASVGTNNRASEPLNSILFIGLQEAMTRSNCSSVVHNYRTATAHFGGVGKNWIEAFESLFSSASAPLHKDSDKDAEAALITISAAFRYSSTVDSTIFDQLVNCDVDGKTGRTILMKLIERGFVLTLKHSLAWTILNPTYFRKLVYKVDKEGNNLLHLAVLSRNNVIVNKIIFTLEQKLSLSELRLFFDTPNINHLRALDLARTRTMPPEVSATIATYYRALYHGQGSRDKRSVIRHGPHPPAVILP